MQIFVAGRHAIIRCGCRQILEKSLQASVTEYSTCAALFEAVQQEGLPSVAVIDDELDQKGGGIECTRLLLKKHRRLRILLLSPRQDTWKVSKALQAGALGFLWRYASPGVLSRAAREVAAGRYFLEKQVSQQLALLEVGTDNPVLTLSRREFEIFQLLAMGKSIPEIAAQLDRKERAIANYQWIIKRKLHISTGAQLVHLAARLGVIDLEN